MVRVLIVDDSRTAREFLSYVIDSDPGLQVIGTASNGEEALEFVRRQKPDVITMDINMPRMNGLEATRRIMEEVAIPIIIVTASWDPREVQTTFSTVEAGALAVLERPEGIGGRNHKESVRELTNTIKVMAEVKVVRRTPKNGSSRVVPPAVQAQSIPVTTKIRVAAIGASTGGPGAIRVVLSQLPKSFPAPILIVQHIAPGFIGGLVDWLNRDSALSVDVARHGEYAEPGCAYIAPDDSHLEIRTDGQLILTKGEPENSLRPSVSHVFRSVAEGFRESALGVILTGMGKDGAAELKLMRDNGGVTIAQDRESSVVFGMPGEAVRLQAASYVLPIEDVASMMVKITGGKQICEREEDKFYG